MTMIQNQVYLLSKFIFFSFFSTATILFTLEDVNDNPPRFTRLNSLNVTENTAIGTNLLQLETVDLDSPENAQVKYKLIQNPDQAFAVHETLGNLSIAKNLDREIRDEYSLKVQASNIASGVTWEIPTGKLFHYIIQK